MLRCANKMNNDIIAEEAHLVVLFPGDVFSPEKDCYQAIYQEFIGGLAAR